MSQKFIGLDDAAASLGVSKDRLNELREAGKLRSYRDGASWKFRSEEIAKMAEEGIPDLGSAASGLSLESAGKTEETEEAAPVTAGPDDSQLDLAEDAQATGAAGSDVQLDDIDEPTVPVDPSEEEASDQEITLGDEEPSDSSDSILLSETELGESTDRPPSTIIGKAELDPEGDLSLATPSDVDPLKGESPQTDSGVLAAAGPSDSMLELEPPSPSESFENLEELEIDLEAESSRILSPEDVVEAKEAASAIGPPVSDLELVASDSDSVVLDSSVDVGAGATGSGLGLSGSSPIALDADEDDDQVLGDGSDITLSSESSGINIVSPSDSGLALDEVSLDLSGSAALGSSLDLGSSVQREADLGTLEGAEPAAPAPLEEEEPFALTPLGEETEEEQDSSQVIALDEISEEAAGASLEAGVAPVLTDDFGTVGLGAGGAMAVAEPTVDTPFSIANIVSLALCLMLLAICGMMSFDLLRNIWSWEGVTSLNSSVLEVLNPFLS
jgi:excisionase family DNA binding protein